MEITDLTAAGHAPRRSARGVAASTVVLAVAASALVSGFLAWMLPPFARVGWVVPIVVVPALVAAISTGQREGRRAMAVTLVAAVVVGSVGAWCGLRPGPAIVGELRAHEAGATAVAEAMMAGYPPGTCQPADSVDLGPLADLGPWDQVCVVGLVDGPPVGFELHRGSAGHALTLAYGAGGSGRCEVQVTDRWRVVVDASDDFSSYCPRGFAVVPSG